MYLNMMLIRHSLRGWPALSSFRMDDVINVTNTDAVVAAVPCASTVRWAAAALSRQPPPPPPRLPPPTRRRRCRFPVFMHYNPTRRRQNRTSCNGPHAPLTSKHVYYRRRGEFYTRRPRSTLRSRL